MDQGILLGCSLNNVTTKNKITIHKVKKKKGWMQMTCTIWDITKYFDFFIPEIILKRYNYDLEKILNDKTMVSRMISLTPFKSKEEFSFDYLWVAYDFIKIKQMKSHD